MRAAVYRGRRDIVIQEVDPPRPGPGDLLLRVGSVGICGTDASEWGSGPHMFPLDHPHPTTGHGGPIIPGHEFSGTVVAVGEGVDQAWIGASVASSGSIACGWCEACASGRSNQCAGYAGVGLHRNGALAEFVSAPAASCVDVGALGISADEAALVQPMGIAVHALSRAGDVSDSTVLVQGVGGVGAFLVWALHSAGARVIATDLDPSRLEIATALGAAAVVDTSDDEQSTSELRTFAPRGFEHIFEVSGSERGLAAALGIAAKGASIVVVGLQKSPRALDLSSLALNEQSLVGTNALVREVDLAVAADLIARRSAGWKDVAPIVLPLEDLVDKGLRPMAEGRSTAIKTLIDPVATRARPSG